MMKYLYSATRNAFFLASKESAYKRNGAWPDDAVAVSDAEYQEYAQSAPPQGMQRGADEAGKPAWVAIPDAPLDQLAAQQRTAIDAARDAAFAAGMTYDFPDGTTDAVQTRPEDKANLLGIAIEARDLRDAGVTDPVIEFRGASNETHALTADQAIAMTNAALSHIKAIYEQSWQRKDAIASALTAEDREGIEAVVW